MTASVTRARYARPEAVLARGRLQRAEEQPALEPHRLRHRAAELLEPVGVRLQLLLPFGVIDAQGALDRLSRCVDAAEIEIAEARRVPDRGLHRPSASDGAVEDPLED